MEAKTVFIVVDPMFGDRLAALAQVGPVWALQTEVNERAIRKLWSDPGLPADHATFFAPQSDRLEPPWLYILDMVDQHHPGWTRMRIYGAHPTDTVRAELASLWEGSIEVADEGFAFNRPRPVS